MQSNNSEHESGVISGRRLMLYMLLGILLTIAASAVMYVLVRRGDVPPPPQKSGIYHRIDAPAYLASSRLPALVDLRFVTESRRT